MVAACSGRLPQSTVSFASHVETFSDTYLRLSYIL